MKNASLLILLAFFLNSQVFSQPPSTISVLVLFSNQATSANNLIDAQSYIDSMNESFANSGLDITMTLAGTEHINYNDQSSIESDLDWLSPHSASSQQNTYVRNLRDNYFADIVVLIVRDNTGFINGKARVLTQGGIPIVHPDYAYAVVAKNRAIDPEYYTFTHEIGHLAGLVHDDETSVPFSYSARGFQTATVNEICPNYSSTASKITIMATQKNSSSVNKINYWSDPNETFFVEISSQGTTDEDDDETGPGNGDDGLFGKIINNCSNNRAELLIGDFYHNAKEKWIESAPTMSQFRYLSAPTGLTVTTGGPYGQPFLNWNDHPSSNILYYKVYRKTNFSNFILISGNLYSSHFTDWNVSNRYGTYTQFQYAVKAFAAGGKSSSYSNSVFYNGILMNSKVVPEGTKAETFLLSKNYPNPFNPSTRLELSLPENSTATLKIYNTAGKKVATLVEGEVNQGIYEINFDASTLPSGIYLAKFEATGISGTVYRQQIKMSLIK